MGKRKNITNKDIMNSIDELLETYTQDMNGLKEFTHSLMTLIERLNDNMSLVLLLTKETNEYTKPDESKSKGVYT